MKNKSQREKELENIISKNAILQFDINYTKGIIPGIVYQNINGTMVNVNEVIGLDVDCDYNDFIAYFGNRIAIDQQEGFYEFFNIDRTIAEFNKGNTMLSYKYWTNDIFGNTVLAHQYVHIYKDEDTGDILAIAYVIDDKNNDGIEKTNSRLEMLENLSAKVPGGYHRCAPSEGFPIIFASDSFLDLIGYTIDELKSICDNKYINLIAPEDLKYFMSHEQILIENGKVNLAYRIVCKDGSRKWVQDVTTKSEKNGEVYYQVAILDISEFINRQNALAQQNLELLEKEEYLETIEKNMPSGYHRCRVEPGCPFIYIGQKFLDILGYTREEIENDFNNLYENLIWGDDKYMHTFTDIATMIGQGNAYDTSVYRMKHKDGGYRWVIDSTMFVDLAEESFFQATISDITEYIEELNEAKAIAEASSQAKSIFLFNASHDIRTPMNAILGFSKIIEDNYDNPQIIKETIAKILKSGNTLMTLLNDILELARIERGKEEINITPLDIKEHINKLYEMFSMEMKQAGIEFNMLNEISHSSVFGDDLKLTRIAMNALSNAKKFTLRGGKITFGVKEYDYDGQYAKYMFYVNDTGIGMDEEFVSRAFEQFERERTSTVSGVSGSGLGLAIIKSICTLMNGECSIESKPGVGTTIYVTIPLKINTDMTKEKQIDINNINFNGFKILLVEDNEFNREIAKYVLNELGFAVDEAVNGLECLDIIQNSSKKYDAILMDIQMPIIDGYEATRKIRALNNSQINSIPIIAMTANAFDEDKQKCLSVGMNGHIGKPIDTTILVEELSKILFKED